MVIVKH